jgi:flagellin FlaB
MERKYMKRLVGNYCKIVTKEPGDSRASVVTGILENVDYEDGFILVDSNQGLGCLRIDTIIAIKPGNPHKRKHKTVLKEDEEAAIGIGTLIVFIAMILVAAVAATVIIQTSENLQQRAYAVGKQTIRQVSSGLEIIDLTGYTDESRSVIQYLAISLKPRAGSYDLDLNQTLVYIEYDNLTVLSLAYEYFCDNGALYNNSQNGSISSEVSSNGVFHTLNLSCLTSTNFGAISIRDSDNSLINSFGMSPSDLIMVLINLSAAFPETGGLEPGEEFFGRVVPEVGSSGIFMVSAPNAFSRMVIDL